MCYIRRMASRVVRARLDDSSEEGLAMLMREGRNESEAVRMALVEAGRRRRRRSELADEVRRLADDPADTKSGAAAAGSARDRPAPSCGLASARTRRRGPPARLPPPQEDARRRIVREPGPAIAAPAPSRDRRSAAGR